MGGQKSESTSHVTHVIVFLVLTVFIEVFGYVLVGHNKDVPARVDSAQAEKGLE